MFLYFLKKSSSQNFPKQIHNKYDPFLFSCFQTFDDDPDPVAWN